MRSTVFLAVALCLAATGTYAGVTINGTTITFDDNTMQTTAKPSDHGGTSNSVSGVNAFIGGGYSNLVTDNFGTISGGQGNVAGLDDGSTQNSWATVGGGENNFASGDWSAVGGGRVNTASASRSTVGGGEGNMASGPASTVSGGNSNIASGGHSTVGGGFGNTASGDFSFAAGTNADDLGNNNSFVWGGAAGARTSAGVDTFNVWSSEIYLNGSVYNSSDRNMKEAFSFVSARAVLDKVVEMPVSTWRFKTEDDSVRHIGPMAQDFMEAFGYGKSDKHITATDADGVALAAIQGLYAMQREELQEQAEVNTALRWHNAQLNSRNDSLEARLRRLERAILREGESSGTD